MADNKRKERPQGPDGGSAPKKSKGGSGGRWRTPHQAARFSHLSEIGTIMEPGDEGFWVTYARGMKTKAIREFSELCDEYAESMYGLKKPDDDSGDKDGDDDDEEPEDIEAAIQKELKDLKPKKQKTRKTFTFIPAAIECLFFVKTMKPVDPIEFVRKICHDARDCEDIMKRKTKYINRLSPVSNMDKATENGLERVARMILEPHFQLVKEEGSADENEGNAKTAEGAEQARDSDSRSQFTYAIRQNIRHHSTLKSDVVIKKVASLVDAEHHKVKLVNPGKVILIEIYQNICGISVVDGTEWEDLKRYNVNELYRLGAEKASGSSKKPDQEKVEDDKSVGEVTAEATS